MTAEKINWQERLLWIVFGVYAVAILYGITNHEPWRDEAQAWLLVRDMSFIKLLKTLPIEVHPPLWYLLIMPLVKLGLPYISQNWLAALIAIGAVYIITFRTQLHIVLKILIPFSYFFLFEYSLFARSYCLIIFFVACIINLYPRRFEKPWFFALSVAGLFNTHVLVFTFAGMLCFMYLVDMVQYKKINKTTIGAFALMAISGLYLIPYLLMTKVADSFQKNVMHYKVSFTTLINEGLVTIANAGPLGIVLLALLLFPLLFRTKALLLVVGGLSGLVYILLYKYVAAIRHDGMICMVILCVYGIMDNYDEDPWNIIRGTKMNIIKYSFMPLALVFVIQLKQSTFYYMVDNQEKLSDSKSAAEFLLDNDQLHHFFVGQHQYAATAILPYLPENIKFFDAFCDRKFTYSVYDSCYFKHVNSEPVDYVMKIVFLSHKSNPEFLYNTIFILNKPANPSVIPYLNTLYRTEDQVIFKEEKYYMYSLRRDVPFD